nr:retrovirus-related Pol polyprotein from transposon TNT 1-94 [Tanacetum cinerariifolium]
NQSDVNDALGYKKKVVVVTSDPLALAKKTKVSKRKEKFVVSSDSEGSEFVKLDDKKVKNKDDEKKRDMSKVKCYNCKKEGHFAKDCKQAKVKDYNYYKTKILLAKKDNDEQVLLAEDQAWMESSSDSDQEINANMVFMAQIEKVLSESDESSSSAEETIVEEIFHDAIESASENFIENHIDSQKDYDNFEVDHNDSEEKEHLVDNKHFEKQNNDFNEQIKVLNEKNTDLLAQTKVVQDQLKVKHVVIDTHTECQAQYAKLEEERYEYMIRYSALCDNDKQHRKKIDEQKILFDKMSHQLVEMNNNVLRLQEKILEKETKISELEGCVSNKDVEIEKCLERLNECENKLPKIGQTNQTIHMIMPSKDTLYNGRKGIGFKNPSYFEKAKDLRPSLYDEKVIDLGYTLMFLIHSDEALEFEKFKRDRENKIEFAYDYGNLNASYVYEKINFSDDYFQEIINSDFEKIDSPFQQISSLKPYVPNVILEKIIIDLEDEVVSLLEKEKANMETIEYLKSKGFDSSENAISESENQSENDYHMVEKSVTKLRILRMNRTLVEAARTMLSFANLPLFLWAEAFATACFTQNRSIIHKRFDKTPYELMNKRKPNIKFFHMFGCRCYLLNDYEDVRKLKEKEDIGVFVGYLKESIAFRIYSKRTRKIHESVNVKFDEILEMASKQFSLEPGLSNLNETGKSLNPSVSQVLETSKKHLEDLFHNFYDEYFDASKIMRSSTTNVRMLKLLTSKFLRIKKKFFMRVLNHFKRNLLHLH